MGKLKRGGFIFITWKGDHDPKHVHVFKDYVRLGKWDLDNNHVMEGNISSKIISLINELQREGKL